MRGPGRFPSRTVGCLLALSLGALGNAAAQNAAQPAPPLPGPAAGNGFTIPVPPPAPTTPTVQPPRATTLPVQPRALPTPGPQVIAPPQTAGPTVTVVEGVPPLSVQQGLPAPSAAPPGPGRQVAPLPSTLETRTRPSTLQAGRPASAPQSGTAAPSPPLPLSAGPQSASPPVARTPALPLPGGPQAAPPPVARTPALPLPGGPQAAQPPVAGTPSLPLPGGARTASPPVAGTPSLPLPGGPQAARSPVAGTPTLRLPGGSRSAPPLATGQPGDAVANPQDVPLPSAPLTSPAPAATAADRQVAPLLPGNGAAPPVPAPQVAAPSTQPPLTTPPAGSETTAISPPAPAEPAQPAAADIAQPQAPADSSPFSPDADVLVETEVLPVLDRFVDRAVALQNAVLRHCLVGHSVSRSALEPIYVVTVQASAALLPLSFGSDDARTIPSRLLTRATSTAFSSSRLEEVMQGASVPGTLTELAQEEAALLGLPALEHLLLRRRYPRTMPLEYRCRLAVPVAANVVAAAVRARHSWLNRDVDVHWKGDEVDLAGRLRLRDLIQGTIDAVDRVGFDLTEFKRKPRNNTAARFSQVRHGLPYLIAATDALRAHVRRLEKFVEPDTPTAALLAEIARALAVSCDRLRALAAGAPNEGRYLIAFEQAHGDIIDALPLAFGFDATAFARTLSSFEVTRTGGSQP